MFIDSISEDVVMYTPKRQDKSYNAFTSHFILGFNISYKTTLLAGQPLAKVKQLLFFDNSVSYVCVLGSNSEIFELRTGTKVELLGLGDYADTSWS